MMEEIGVTLKDKCKKWFRRDNLLILILSGVLLFIIALPTKDSSGGEKAGEEKSSTGQQGNETDQLGNSDFRAGVYTEGDFAAELEKRLEAVLCEMSGAGKVKVMITLRSSEELVVEKDEPMTRSSTNENDAAGGSRIVTQMEATPATVFVTNGNESEPYVVKTISPQVEGVVVVAQGAGNGTVNKNITEMVQALFGVEAHKVKVVKMEQMN